MATLFRLMCLFEIMGFVSVFESAGIKWPAMGDHDCEQNLTQQKKKGADFFSVVLRILFLWGLDMPIPFGCS